MPHLDFEAARRQRQRSHGDPLTFGLGGETFTCLAAPTLGDAIDLAISGTPTIYGT